MNNVYEILNLYLDTYFDNLHIFLQEVNSKFGLIYSNKEYYEMLDDCQSYVFDTVKKFLQECEKIE